MGVVHLPPEKTSPVVEGTNGSFSASEGLCPPLWPFTAPLIVPAMLDRPHPFFDLDMSPAPGFLGVVVTIVPKHLFLLPLGELSQGCSIVPHHNIVTLSRQPPTANPTIFATHNLCIPHTESPTQQRVGHEAVAMTKLIHDCETVRQDWLCSRCLTGTLIIHRFEFHNYPLNPAGAPLFTRRCVGHAQRPK